MTMVAYALPAAVGVGSMVLYNVLERAFVASRQQGKKSSDAEAHALANKFVALLHSFATVTFALIVLASFPYQKDLFALKHKGVSVLIAWEVSYLMHDTWSMFLQKWRFQRPLDSMVMTHHIVLSLLLPLYFRYQYGDFYLAMLYLQNASTPLLHARYMLLKSDLKGSILHKVCAVSLLVVFFIVRLLLWPAVFTIFSYSADVPILGLHRRLHSYCLIVPALMFAMNFAWWLTLVSKIGKLDMRMQFGKEGKQGVYEVLAKGLIGKAKGG